jgi:hypothetical protein
MPWTWIIPEGAMLDPTGAVLTHGYSGHGAGIDSVDAIGDVNVGPLPCGPHGSPGMYTLGPLLQNAGPGPLQHLGPRICQLIPSPAQRAFIVSLGRDPNSFYCHGGVAGEVPTPTPGFPAPTGSEGCIVLIPVARMVVLQSPDRQLVCLPAAPGGQPAAVSP